MLGIEILGMVWLVIDMLSVCFTSPSEFRSSISARYRYVNEQ